MTHGFTLKDNTLVLAKCDIDIHNNIVYLDYAGANSAFSMRNWEDAGQARIIFVGQKFVEMKTYEWRSENGQFEEERISFEQETVIGEPEGDLYLAFHTRRERSPALVAKKIKSVRATGAPLRCEACSFDFAQVYGELGVGFCEVQHRKPLAEGPRIVRLDDLAILCANCHRMIHRTAQAESIMSVEDFAAKHVQKSN